MQSKEHENKRLLKRILIADAYKFSHGLMYPKNTINLFSTLTARNSYGNKFKDFDWEAKDIEDIIFPIINDWASAVYYLTPGDNKVIFRKLAESLSPQVADFFVESLIALRRHMKEQRPNQKAGEEYAELKLLPITIKIASSHVRMGFQKPLITITGNEYMNNNFVWLVNFFETIILQNIWQYTTSCTIARDAWLLCHKYAELTTPEVNRKVLNLQCHDFSMRGMSSLDSSIMSAKGHLNWFNGSDTILAGDNAVSVPASEHSVMVALGKERELETYENLINLFPKGILSIVSDTWNLWNVLENILPKLKDKILARNGRVVIRPDSGKPIDIICGTKTQKGTLELLWETFGGTTNSRGYKVLNPKVGVIYGDGLTLESMKEIFEKMKKLGWASTNIVFGMGAFLYQYNTRDTLGFAMKATAILFNEGEWQDLIKDPITDPNKKSLTGRFKI